LEERKRKRLTTTFSFSQERGLGDQNRLETDVVLAVNDAFQRIFLKGSLSIVAKLTFGLLGISDFLSWKINQNFFFEGFLVLPKKLLTPLFQAVDSIL